jgi:hypothetical protein
LSSTLNLAQDLRCSRFGWSSRTLVVGFSLPVLIISPYKAASECSPANCRVIGDGSVLDLIPCQYTAVKGRMNRAVLLSPLQPGG